MNSQFLVPFLLTLGAGLATGIGSAVALLTRRTNKRLLSFSLGLSGGVMIYVSFVELFRQSCEALSSAWGERVGMVFCVVSFFGGILLIGIIDRLVPSVENPHEAHSVEEMDRRPRHPRLMRMGVLTALAIAIHNFPEGIATFTAAVDSSALGVAIAIAIAIHNIPEGIAVSVPIFYATGNRRQAFWLSFLSGLAEPVGAFARLGGPYAFHVAHIDGLRARRRRRNHGLHFHRRAAAGPRNRLGRAQHPQSEEPAAERTTDAASHRRRQLPGRICPVPDEDGPSLSAIETVAEKDPAAAAFIVKTTQYFVPLAGMIDTDAERKKLTDDLAYYEGFLASVMKKLSNERFVSSAPEKVVANERAKQADAEAKIAAIKEQLKALGN